jgi:hypothetical protein
LINRRPNKSDDITPCYKKTRKSRDSTEKLQNKIKKDVISDYPEERLAQGAGLHDVLVLVVEGPGLDLRPDLGQLLLLRLHLLVEPDDKTNLYRKKMVSHCVRSVANP